MANNRVTDIKNPFKEVFEALDLKEQRKAMKGAMRREGNRVKRAAVANLSSSPVGCSKSIKKICTKLARF
jgi:hypothetical protein